MSKKKKRKMTGAKRDRIKARRKEERRRLIMRAKNIKKKKADAKRPKKEAPVKDILSDTEKQTAPEKESGRGKKKISYFYLFYFAFIIIFFAALFFTLEVVKGKLADYEASRPYNYIDAVMEEYFKPGDAEKILDASGYKINVFERRSDVVSLVEGFLDEGAEYYKITSQNGNEQKYAVRSGELKFAEVTMAAKGRVDRAGYDVWELDGITLMIGGGSAVNVSAPGDTAVYINGTQIPDDYVVDRVEYEKDPKLPQEIPPDTRVTYEVSGLIGELRVTATNRYGADVTDLIEVTDGVFYDVPYTYAFVTDDVRERALAAGEALAAYMQKDAGFYGIGQYVDPSSDLYTDLRTSDVRWANEHNGYGIADPSVTEFVMWSDSVYSVRVRFTHVLYRWGGNFENEFDTTFYYKVTDGRWLIYDSHVN